MIARELKEQIEKRLDTNKAIIILGPRQVGKTTLLKQIFESRNDVMWLNGDDRATVALFEDVNAQTIRAMVRNNKILIIDEAQRIENIGLKMKIIHDSLKENLQIVATGSSSFDLANKINEPMTGRKWTFKMFPLSFYEMVEHTNLVEEKMNLDNRLLYGYYPDVVNNMEDARIILNEIVNENLYKDIYKWEEIRKPVQWENLARALAFQVGSQVSTTELSQLVGLTPATTEKYIRLLEQSFVIFRLGSFSRNLRNELKASDKYYFYDTGIRNALIGDFTPISARQDIGHLFENFIIGELAKKYMPSSVGSFANFWRTTNQQEIDFLVERDGEINAYEFKWNPKAKARIPKTFTDAYPNAKVSVITRENFENILLN